MPRNGKCYRNARRPPVIKDLSRTNRIQVRKIEELTARSNLIELTGKKSTFNKPSDQPSCRPASDVIKRISDDLIRSLKDTPKQSCNPIVYPRTNTESVTPTMSRVPSQILHGHYNTSQQCAPGQSKHLSQKDLLHILGDTSKFPPPESIQRQPMKRAGIRTLSLDSEATQNLDQGHNSNRSQEKGCRSAQGVRNRRNSYFNNDSRVLPSNRNLNKYSNGPQKSTTDSTRTGETIQYHEANAENCQTQEDESSYTYMRINNQMVQVRKSPPPTYSPRISLKSSQKKKITTQYMEQRQRQDNAAEQQRSNNSHHLQISRKITHSTEKVAMFQKNNSTGSRTIFLKRNTSSEQTIRNSETTNYSRKRLAEIMLQNEIVAEHQNSSVTKTIFRKDCSVVRETKTQSQPKTIPRNNANPHNVLNLSPNKKMRTQAPAPVTEPSFGLGSSVSAPPPNMEHGLTGTQSPQNIENQNSITTQQESVGRLNSTSLDPSSSVTQHLPSKQQKNFPETLKSVSTTPKPGLSTRFSQNGSPLFTNIDGVVIEELVTPGPSRRRQLSIEDDEIQTCDNLQGEEQLVGLVQPLHTSVESEKQSAELQHETQLRNNQETPCTMSQARSQGTTLAILAVTTENTPQATTQRQGMTQEAPQEITRRSMTQGVPQVTTQEMNPSMIQDTPQAMTKATTARTPKSKSQRKTWTTTPRTPWAKTPMIPRDKTQDMPHSSTQIMTQCALQSNLRVTQATGAPAMTRIPARRCSVTNSTTRVMRPNVLTVTDSSAQTTQDSLMEMAKYSSPIPLSQWSCTRVKEFVLEETGFQELADKFFEQDIDGAALSILNCDHLIQYFGARLGTAIRLIDRVRSLSYITWKSLTNEDP